MFPTRMIPFTLSLHVLHLFHLNNAKEAIFVASPRDNEINMRACES